MPDSNFVAATRAHLGHSLIERPKNPQSMHALSPRPRLLRMLHSRHWRNYTGVPLAMSREVIAATVIDRARRANWTLSRVVHFIGQPLHLFWRDCRTIRHCRSRTKRRIDLPTAQAAFSHWARCSRTRPKISAGAIFVHNVGEMVAPTTPRHGIAFFRQTHQLPQMNATAAVTRRCGLSGDVHDDCRAFFRWLRVWPVE